MQNNYDHLGIFFTENNNAQLDFISIDIEFHKKKIAKIVKFTLEKQNFPKNSQFLCGEKMTYYCLKKNTVQHNLRIWISQKNHDNPVTDSKPKQPCTKLITSSHKTSMHNLAIILAGLETTLATAQSNKLPHKKQQQQ
jgi:hypothetical protein